MKKNMIKYTGLSELEVLKEAKNYNKWIADEILSYISTPAIEIGAGTGNLTSHFLIKRPLYVSDADSGLVDKLKQKFKKHTSIFIDVLDITKTPPKKFRSFFSTIFGINVLEHLENDIGALKHIHIMLNDNGKVVLLMPAKKFAYTRLDKELGHYRRYEKEEVIDKLKSSGFFVEKIYFFNIVGLISWFVRDKLNKKDVRLKPYHIKFFDSIVPVLRKIESRVRIPIGISLIVVARKI